MLEPAKTVIEICGGFEVVAEVVGRHETRVRRWTYEKSKGGTGGHIPADIADKLYSWAVSRNLPLKAEHFFTPPSNSLHDVSLPDAMATTERDGKENLTSTQENKQFSDRQ